MPFISYVGKNLFTVHAVGCETIRFLPGINEVSDNALEAMKKHPAFQARLQDKSLVIIMENKPEADGKKSIKDMMEYIPKIFDSKLLRKIIETDGRDSVVSAAKDQLAQVKPGKKEPKEDDNANHFR